jgi:hypothetical protein
MSYILVLITKGGIKLSKNKRTASLNGPMILLINYELELREGTMGHEHSKTMGAWVKRSESEWEKGEEDIFQPGGREEFDAWSK